MSGPASHLGGFHGTSSEIAQQIEMEGFELTDKSFVCFTPMDDEGLERARDYGRQKAEQAGGDSYGVIVAAFSPKGEEYDAHGRPQIEVPPNEIGSILVMNVFYFGIND